jgi:GT2 family glycosyltransferase/glycosyltransferase involved in cell wall biosynthesis
VVAEKEVQGRVPLRGFLDEVKPNGISGWAINELHPDQSVMLSIYVDGNHMMDVATSHRRQDLINKGIPGACAGFSVEWPSGMLEVGAQVDVRFRFSDESLSQSPRQMPSGPAPRSGDSAYMDNVRGRRILPVTIVVPVYNAHDAVVECLASLELHAIPGAKVLVINDSSTDARIQPMLEGYRRSAGFEVHRNESNLGYTRTINKAIDLAQGRDIVLLNSDTVVTERWLDNLRYAAYSKPRVATVTAMSDNAGAFSAPEYGVHNPLPAHLSSQDWAHVATQSSPGWLLDVPTGNGFCLYIRRDALSQLGAFDEQKYPRGYGEENDFCMRARRNGWVNLVSDKALVYHKRSQSFLGEKAELMEAGAAQLSKDYPEYRMLTPRFRDAQFNYVRHRMRVGLRDAKSGAIHRRVLYVVSTQTGGTPQTNMDLMQAMHAHYQCLLLRCDTKTMTLSELVDDKLVVRESHVLSQPIDPILHRSDEYDAVAAEWLYRYSISLLHIRHIGWHSMGLADVAKSMRVPVVYSVHDFYSVCPSLNLLDEKLQYCGGNCTSSEGDGDCQVALWKPASLPSLKHRFVKRWREMFAEFIGACDHLITTSESAKATFLEFFPDAREKLTVIPHGRNFDEFRAGGRIPARQGKVRVLVPGNISLSKGAALIKELAELDVDQRFEFHILGEAWSGLNDVGVHHGKYERRAFADKVGAIAPHLGIVLSIWPETYCHTLTEMWACGVPVMGIDVGAVGDRIRASGAGWLITPGSAASAILDRLTAAVDHTQDYESKVDAVRAWQATEGNWNDTATMAVEYRRIYSHMLGDGRCGRIGLLVKGRRRHPPTAHIRVLQPMLAVEESSQWDIRTVDAGWLLAGGIDRVDGLVVQRDAVPSALAVPLIERLREQGVPYIYEIDDLLWNLPAEHTDHDIDAAQREALLALIANASLVTTSTHDLAEPLRRLNPNVRVIPNTFDAGVWLRPLPGALLSEVAEQCHFGTDRLRILYMGSRSHAHDLEMIAPAIEEVIGRFPGVEVVQIGGGCLLPGARELKAPKERSAYLDFVDWFRAVASHCTVAIAPLKQSEFNSMKSDIKYVDYALAGVPAVFSRFGPYAHTVKHGETGILSDNSVDSWVEAIGGVLSDPELRDHIREAASLDVAQRAIRPAGALHWQSALEALLDTEFEAALAQSA